MYYRLGHIEPSVKVGQKVKKGEQVGTNGTGNGQWSAHCHFDIFKERQTNWNAFVVGWSKAKVREVYQDPRGLEKIVLPTLDHYGYVWLEDAQYSGGHAYHSGLDLNGKGAGNSDFGDPICSPVNGVVVHVHKGTDSNGGWGDMCVIEEVISNDTNMSNVAEIMSKGFGKDYGNNFDDKDAENAVEKYESLKHELDTEISKASLLGKSNAKLSGDIEKLNTERNNLIEEVKEWKYTVTKPPAPVTKFILKHAEDFTALELIRMGIVKFLNMK